jgi:hypothetical protein
MKLTIFLLIAVSIKLRFENVDSVRNQWKSFINLFLSLISDLSHSGFILIKTINIYSTNRIIILFFRRLLSSALLMAQRSNNKPKRPLLKEQQIWTRPIGGGVAGVGDGVAVSITFITSKWLLLLLFKYWFHL